MKPILLAAVAGICFVIACKNGKQSTSIKSAVRNPSFLNGAWQLNYITGPQITFDGLYPEKKPQLVFDVASSHISGNTSCNSFAGAVALSGNKLSIDQSLITTKMFCPGDGETVFLETLKKIQSWSAKDAATLELLMDETPMMRFTKVQ
ncbi:MAG: META domain-containing protein [Bacteroidota bacterium]|nr:META domain-containing protein [Bacteroidota bacterium]